MVLVVGPGVLRALTLVARKRRVLGVNQAVAGIWGFKGTGQARLILETKGVKRREGRGSAGGVLEEPAVGRGEASEEGQSAPFPVEP